MGTAAAANDQTDHEQADQKQPEPEHLPSPINAVTEYHQEPSSSSEVGPESIEANNEPLPANRRPTKALKELLSSARTALMVDEIEFLERNQPEKDEVDAARRHMWNTERAWKIAKADYERQRRAFDLRHRQDAERIRYRRQLLDDADRELENLSHW
jgi:hypothetical protein